MQLQRTHRTIRFPSGGPNTPITTQNMPNNIMLKRLKLLSKSKLNGDKFLKNAEQHFFTANTTKKGQKHAKLWHRCQAAFFHAKPLQKGKIS